ncbi:MAG: type II toxin-antitoxin system VapB family antitoxin [Thermomicrobiales bacterium]
MVRIDDPEVERLVLAIAQRTGETAAEVVTNALRERLAREEARALDVERIVEEAMAIGRHFASLPVLDARSFDELLGYDERGLPN